MDGIIRCIRWANYICIISGILHDVYYEKGIAKWIGQFLCCSGSGYTCSSVISKYFKFERFGLKCATVSKPVRVEYCVKQSCTRSASSNHPELPFPLVGRLFAVFKACRSG